VDRPREFAAEVATAGPERVVYRYVAKRRALPDRRMGPTQKFRIGGQSVFLRIGEYEDGSLGEIWLTLNKQGTITNAFANAFAIAVSLGLQYGVPLEEFVEAFLFINFEPNGPVQKHPQVKSALSILDVVFRDLAINYLGREDLSHATADATIAQDEAKQPEATYSPVLSPDAPGDVLEAVARKREARLKGYDGDPCRNCQRLTLIRNGKCLRCETCGTTTGCS
jgi:ribonucleoside-diphosphate reductase alpha chain